jgi:acyl-CoA thioesterase-1
VLFKKTRAYFINNLALTASMLALISLLFSTLAWADADHPETTPSSTTQKVLILGDSLSAAYGLEQEQGWVNLLQNMLQAQPETQHIQLINAAISGETTDGGVSRLPRLLSQHAPDVVLIELGGNDGLQGHSIPKLRENLATLIKLTQEAGAQPIVQAMQIPTNYGRRYNNMFIESFTQLADEVPVVPFFLADIALDTALMQRDGIHPTAEAQPLIAEFMHAHFIPLVKAAS